MGYYQKRVNTHNKFGISSQGIAFADKGGGGQFYEDPLNNLPLISSTYNEAENDGQWNYFPTETSLQVNFTGGNIAATLTRTFTIWSTDYTGVDKFPPYTCVTATGTVSTLDRFNMYRLTWIPFNQTPATLTNTFLFISDTPELNQNTAEEIAGDSTGGDFDVGLLTSDGINLGGTVFYADNCRTLNWKIAYDGSVPTNQDIYFNFHIILF